MSALPDQLQAQVAEVEAIEAEIAKAAQPDGDPPSPPSPDTPQGDPAPPPAPPAPAPAQPPAEGPEVWEHRYKTLQGIHRADLARLEGQVRDLQSQSALKDGRIQELEAAAKRTPEPPKPAPISQEDTEKFGPEIIDLISRQAAHVAEQLTAPVKEELEAKKAEIAELKKQVGGVAENQGQVRRTGYQAELTKLCPTWQTVNVDPAFGTWLSEIDELSGVPRQALLQDAYVKFDHDRTARIFNQFLQQAAPPPPPAPPAPARPTLESQQTPGSSRVDAPPGNPTDAKIWSTAEVDNFYAAVRRREYTPADAARIEAEIDAAVATGRVR